ncbi:MAG TPA: hypothetical protein VGR90_01420, partial [Acidimicrobiales bacterium]|nr:hypothetical protein [Acidimicrobiales bacterium]
LGGGSVTAALAGPSDPPKAPPAKSEHWGVIDRNTIGSPVAQLRDGPFSPVASGEISAPPFGKGSLGIEVENFSSSTNMAEKVAYGNEVDFLGDPVLGLTQVGFYVFQTVEDTQAPANPDNMPNITLEINPQVPGHSYTSMVWDPPPSPTPDAWSPYMDATTTGTWYFTGSTGTAVGCSLSTPCTFSGAMAALQTNNDGTPPTIYTVAIAKGRDYSWQGAVDGLRINNQIFDFEADGVHAHSAN